MCQNWKLLRQNSASMIMQADILDFVLKIAQETYVQEWNSNPQKWFAVNEKVVPCLSKNPSPYQKKSWTYFWCMALHAEFKTPNFDTGK